MAVHAALINSQFLNFCFPSSGMEFGLERCLERGLLREEERDEGGYTRDPPQDEQGYPREGRRDEEGYPREPTRDLLSFIDSASSNIKLALDKPVKSRRKVNHRKYLQKQIKRCTGLLGPPSSPLQHSPTRTPADPPSAPDLVRRQGSPEAPQPHPPPCKTGPLPPNEPPVQPPPQPQAGSGLGKMPPKRDEVLANLQSKSLAALFNSANKESRGERAKKPPLRHRNLPPSFFTEPANYSRGAISISVAPHFALKDLERANPEPSDFMELLGSDYSSMLLDQDLFQNGPGSGPLLTRAQTDCSPPGLGHAPLSYEAQHYVTGGFVYTEPWSPCLGSPKRLGGEGGRTGQGPQPALYSPGDAGGPATMEDGSHTTIPFPATFFTDCPSTQETFDGGVSGGYSQGSFSSL